MRVSDDDLKRWEREGWLSPEQVQHIRQDLLGHNRLTMATALYYVGGFLVVLAWALLLGLNWSRTPAGGQLLLAGISSGLLLGAGAWLRARGLIQAGGLLCLGGSGGFPLIFYALLRLMHMWPADSAWQPGDDHRRAVAWAILWLGSAVAALAVVIWQRFPLLTLGVGAANWGFGLNLAGLFLHRYDFQRAALVSVGWGLLCLCVGVVLDRGVAKRWGKDYLGWWYLSSLLVFSGSFATYALADGRGAAVIVLYLLAHIGLIVLGQRVQRLNCMVIGALGLYAYVLRLAFVTFENSISFPVAMVALGALLIGGGVVLQRWLGREDGPPPRQVDWF